MPVPANSTVYIVDDDSSVREALSWMLRTRRLHNESFESAKAFLAALPQEFLRLESTAKTPKAQFTAKNPCCLLLDVRMPNMSGLELFNELLAHGLQSALPVIFLTGHADIPTAVTAVKNGAFDFCEKPFSNNVLVDRIEAALLLSSDALARNTSQRAIEKRLGELTEREQAVMQFVIEGITNKETAERLGISVRTVEVHRARVFEKLSVKSAVELANLLRVGV